MEELLKTIKGLVNGIRIPKKIKPGYLNEWEEWEDGLDIHYEEASDAT